MLETIAATALWCVVVTHASAPAEPVVLHGLSQAMAGFALDYVAVLPDFRAVLAPEPCEAVE